MYHLHKARSLAVARLRAFSFAEVDRYVKILCFYGFLQRRNRTQRKLSLQSGSRQLRRADDAYSCRLVRLDKHAAVKQRNSASEEVDLGCGRYIKSHTRRCGFSMVEFGAVLGPRGTVTGKRVLCRTARDWMPARGLPPKRRRPSARWGGSGNGLHRQRRRRPP